MLPMHPQPYFRHLPPSISHVKVIMQYVPGGQPSGGIMYITTVLLSVTTKVLFCMYPMLKVKVYVPSSSGRDVLIDRSWARPPIGM